MTLYKPQPYLGGANQRLLRLLTDLLLEQLEKQNEPSNVPDGRISVSAKEADDLRACFERLLESRDFRETCFFVEHLFEGRDQDDRMFREIYLSQRRRRGRSRALASINWADFKARLGLPTPKLPYSRTIRMERRYFLKMEEQLLETLDIHPRVAATVLAVVKENISEVERMIKRRRGLREGAVRELFADPYFRWNSESSVGQESLVSTRHFAAAITVLVDFSVLFTTRDWSVTGTLSTMSGAVAAMSKGD